jgi:hypothetical protein
LQSHERRHLIVEAIRRIARTENSFANFSDKVEPENYVQITGDGVLEVTSRKYGGVLPPLDYHQILALTDLGFAAHPDPNYRKDVVIEQAQTIANVCEEAFVILACSPTFDLNIELEEAR